MIEYPSYSSCTAIILQMDITGALPYCLVYVVYVCTICCAINIVRSVFIGAIAPVALNGIFTNSVSVQFDTSSDELVKIFWIPEVPNPNPFF